MDNQLAKVLIVDDETVNIKVLVATLDQYDCVVAKSGEKALCIAAAPNPPDIILLDVNMPGIDGYEVCQNLKNDSVTKNIPVIFITVKGTVEEETKGLELGAVDYIAKPFSPSIVKARVANHIELKQQRDLLASLNLTDALTGIANRRRFDDSLDYVWNTAIRSKSELSLILIDIDSFKAVNDHGGHVYGDECLRKIATALNNCVQRSMDVVARYGGEEFAVILPNTDRDTASRLAEKMRACVVETQINHPDTDKGPYVTISLGVESMLPLPDMTPQSLIEKADSNLYKAKHAGKNQVFS